MRFLFLILFSVVMMVSSLTASADYELLKSSPQNIYFSGVPHVDNKGKIIKKYNSENSSFLLGLYHARDFSDKSNKIPIPLEKLNLAGFNTVYPTFNLNKIWLDRLTKNNMRIISCPAAVDDAKLFAKHPALLAYDVIDEPDSDGRFEEYPNRFKNFEIIRKGIREYDKVRPVYVTNVAWIMQPNLEWWIKWQQTSDIACQDNYPIEHWPGSGTKLIPPIAQNSLSYINGIPESVKLSVNVTKEKKPVWFIVQAFTDGTNGRWAYPTPKELRLMVYTSIVHGASGIVYFTFDNYVCRDQNIYGISPEPREHYGSGISVNSKIISQIRKLWDASSVINSQINYLKPWLLSPTARIDYNVYIKGTKISDCPIRAILKKKPNSNMYLLLVVNVDRTPLDVKIKIDQQKNKIQKIIPLFNLKQVRTLQNSGFEDRFEPFDTRAYLLKIDRNK